MGYSHYFENKGHKDDEQNFLKVLADAKKLYDNMPEHSESAGGYYKDKPLELFDYRGIGKPVFHTTEITFNGDDYKDLSHETFSVFPHPFHDFCKTARKPYDLMVCAVLISMKKHMVNFTYSSDGIGTVGSTDDWKPARDFYEKVCGN